MKKNTFDTIYRERFENETHETVHIYDGNMGGADSGWFLERVTLHGQGRGWWNAKNSAGRTLYSFPTLAEAKRAMRDFPF